RDRLRDRLRLRARRAPVQLARAADQRLHRVPVHRALDRALPGARAADGDHGDDDRDRPRWLHAAHPVRQHARRPAQRPARRDRGGAGHGADAAPSAPSRRGSARVAGDRCRDPNCRRDDDQPGDRGGVHHAVRPRQADLRRAADQLPHGVRHLRSARDRARARGRRDTRARAARADAVAEGTRVILAATLNGHTFIDAFRFLWDDRSFVGQKVLEHVELSAVSVGIAAAIALPIGVWLGHIHRGSFVAINGSNLLRALPSLAVISIFLPALGIGHTVVVIALAVRGAPLILTNSSVAVDAADPDVVEAARGMGLTPLQILLRVELPLALRLIFAGIRTAAVYIVATATLAGVVGGGSLGDIIFNQ